MLLNFRKIHVSCRKAGMKKKWAADQPISFLLLPKAPSRETPVGSEPPYASTGNFHVLSRQVYPFNRVLEQNVEVCAVNDWVLGLSEDQQH